MDETVVLMPSDCVWIILAKALDGVFQVCTAYAKLLIGTQCLNSGDVPVVAYSPLLLEGLNWKV